jgi:hypothetical protein
LIVDRLVAGTASASTSKIASAATMPDFIAVCVPLIFGTLRKPAASPMSATAREGELGDRLEAALVERARAIGDAPPPSKTGRISGWVLKRWNSSNGER